VHGKSYEHGFAKKLCVKSSFNRVEFRSIFRALSRKFKILTIPVVLALGKSYEHGCAKKCDGHKFCTMSRSVKFRSIFHAPSQKFKYWPFLMYKPMGRRTNTVSQKNTMVINFA
ncbi:hypothetical protein B296_00032937, partial [Ensete ventricosum]